jgi:3-oxoacyl-[acyl-carrier protein] reductase
METSMTAKLEGDKLDSIRRRSPFRRFPSSADVAGTVAFLLGPDAGMITGTSITVDAGSSA